MKRARFLNPILLLALFVALIIACEKSTSVYVQSQTGAPAATGDNQLHVHDSQKLRAEKLVASAERLISPVSFFYADEILDLALKADPDNRLALFYKALLAPGMKFRGILNRVGLHSNLTIRRWAMSDRSYYENARGGFKDFLYAPGQPFTNEQEVQSFIAEVLGEQNKLIDFVKKNRSFLTKIVFPYTDDYERLISFCSVVKTSEGSYRIDPCPYLTMLKFQVNRADWESILGMWNGTKIMMTLALGYDFEGLIDYSDADFHRSFKSQRSTFTYLKTHNPHFGMLRPDNRMREILGMASDIYGGFKWLNSVQNQVCDDKKRSPFLMDRMVCLPKDFIINRRSGVMDTQSAINVLYLSMAGMGGTLQFVKPKKGGMTGQPIKETRIDILALIKDPVLDAKTLLPDQFTNCGRAKRIPDPTLGGSFPDRNAMDVLTQDQLRHCVRH